MYQLKQWGSPIRANHSLEAFRSKGSTPFRITFVTIRILISSTLVLRCVWLFVSPGTGACQAPLSREFSRQKYWSGLLFPSPGYLPDPGVEHLSLVSPALAGRFFTTVPLGKAFGGKFTGKEAAEVTSSFSYYPARRQSWVIQSQTYHGKHTK